jgi:hypothetical protein
MRRTNSALRGNGLRIDRAVIHDVGHRLFFSSDRSCASAGLAFVLLYVSPIDIARGIARSSTLATRPVQIHPEEFLISSELEKKSASPILVLPSGESICRITSILEREQ